jgi:NAD(P)-dependent dehydrogenase (short-subunit alcohol dehydrogenase family)
MDIRNLIDDLLEITVVGSFSRIGPAVRSRLFRWTMPPREAMAGRTVLVTGPTSGLGLETTRALAALGARVVLAGRSEVRLAGLRDDLVAAHGEDRFPMVVVDMASLASVRSAVARVLATESRLDVVIDNAGAIYPERTFSPEGIEASLATMVVGPFVLVAGLLPLLERTPGSRVIAVTSGGMYAQALDLSDLTGADKPYEGTRAYARAKRAQVALVREWARRSVGSVSFAAMHPGWADSPGLADSLPGFHRVMGPLLRSPAQGADTIVWLAADPASAAADGALYLDRRARPFDRLRSTRLSAADRRRLWGMVVELAAVADPLPDPAS